MSLYVLNDIFFSEISENRMFCLYIGDIVNVCLPNVGINHVRTSKETYTINI